MRLAIIGVGQTLDFESGKMRDVLEVALPDGQVIMIPTTNDAANQLVRLVMGNQTQRVSEVDGGEFGRASDPELRDQDYDGLEPLGEMGVDGAVFGGSEDETQTALIEEIEQRDRLPTRQQAAASAKQDDRSGIPSHTLPGNMVDDKGNPLLLPAPAGLADDDEDDPGEQL